MRGRGGGVEAGAVSAGEGGRRGGRVGGRRRVQVGGAGGGGVGAPVAAFGAEGLFLGLGGEGGGC